MAVATTAFGAIGVALLLSAHAATPAASVEAESGVAATNASIVSDATASNNQAIAFRTANATPTAYPARGSVGYQPANCPNGVTVINSAATVPAGDQWVLGGLKVGGTNPTLNCVQVVGGLSSYATGTLKITNSIIEGGGTQSWLILGFWTGNLDIENSTVRYCHTTLTVNGVDLGCTGINANATGAGVIADQTGANAVGVKIIHNDISGNGDGLQPDGDGWIITDNWIHNLSGDNGNHSDGIQIFTGTGISIARNRIEAITNGIPNSGIFTQGDTIGAVSVDNNFIDGGGYSLYMQDGKMAVTNNVFGPDFRYANHLVENNNGDTAITAWNGNCIGDAAGNKLIPCQAVSQ